MKHRAGMIMASDERNYVSYLLRLWWATSAGKAVWHVSVEDPHTGARKTFSDIEGLFTFLARQTNIGVEQSVRHPSTMNEGTNDE